MVTRCQHDQATCSEIEHTVNRLCSGGCNFGGRSAIEPGLLVSIGDPVADSIGSLRVLGLIRKFKNRNGIDIAHRTGASH